MNVKKMFSIIEWLIALILVSTCIYYYIFSYGSFDATDAFRASEKSLHYGPSKIKKVIELKNAKIYFGRYRDWISTTVVEKRLIKWYPGDGAGGFPINYSDKISHTWMCGRIGDKANIYTVSGYVNDPNIITVNLKYEQKGKERSMKYNIDSDKMFIFCRDDNENRSNFISLTGLDKDGRVVYEYKYPQ